MAAKERAIRRPSRWSWRRRVVPLFLLALATGPTVVDEAAAQQPQQQPASWGSNIAPPAPILGLNDARPILPLEFSRAWLKKVEAVKLRRQELLATGELDGLTPDQLAEQGAALSGRLRIPVIPVRYADVPVPFGEDALRERLFGNSQGDTLSFADYWDEVSGGLLQVEGEVAPWVTLRRPARHYLPAEQFGWSAFGRVAELRAEALAAAAELIDFAQFDNDGPDGIPNSGDDDGYVDFVAILYALPCQGDTRAGAIWPHRAAMPPLETTTIGADGEPIRIADYVIIPAMDPVTCGPTTIGVLAHETGHALGLPDLYDYDGSSQGIGAWGLMGTGSHATHYSPAHLSAWEKAQLGWVTVSWLAQADSAVAMAPVQESRTVFRFDGDGDEYYLIENRQRRGSDRFLPGSGMLVWHVDPERAELGAWNSDERRAAVSLIEADGRGDLARGRQADAGDPFPGKSERDWFRTLSAGGLQFTRLEEEEGTGVVTGHLLAGEPLPAIVADPGWLRLTALAGGHAVRQVIEIRRLGDATQEWESRHRASWLDVERTGDTLVLTADPAGLSAGTYADEILILDEAGDSAVSVAVHFYLATPGVGQIIATELPWSWGVAVRGGRILQASYGWDQLGLRPRPRVLQLWEGDRHPRTLARLAADALYAPIIDPRDDATFVLARARDGNFLYQIRGNGDAHIIATRIGTQPAYGAAILPDGSVAVAQWDGAISHVRRDGSVHPWMALGTNIYQIASDYEGNLFAAAWSGDVIRIAPDGTRRIIETGFGPGRLVTVTTTPSGDVIAAERGGQGRILSFAPDGRRDVVYHSPGARYYGLAVDDGFLFALDLTQRHLLRIPLPPQPPVVALSGAGRDP
ncbi:MAG TPA: M6 family metalloprotease domain-containing protein [Longimicrobiales bacterium]|nr:M6 family metalloprotease domain-containing protein [Longimicrobiales bacterium]